jgi:formylglycine-generating enzyme required for sulfatase activity
MSAAFCAKSGMKRFAIACLLLAASLAATGCTKPKPVAKAEVKQSGREMVVHLRNDITMKLVLAPAGKFMMGSPDNEPNRDKDEGPRRTVTVGKPFFVGVTEVTQEQYEAVMEDNPSTFQGPRNPVEEVSWEDAVAFCKELSRLTGRKFHLPTEAQWEYACRAGTQSLYHSGGGLADLKRVGQFASDPANVKSTRPVAGLEANAWGLYDMHGNVWEWCSDWYGEGWYADDRQAADPTGPATGSERIIRGGSWSDDPQDCRCAVRECQPPGYTDDDIGFRVVCDE